MKIILLSGRDTMIAQTTNGIKQMDLNKIKEYLTTAKEKGQLTYPYNRYDSWLVKEVQDVLQLTMSL